MELIFASNNKSKLYEIKKKIHSSIKIISLDEIGITEEIPEPYFTFEENAHAKATYVYNKTGKNCFAEDSGIIAKVLGNQPGVLSSRFAGTQASDEDNNKKLLAELNGKSNREAYYRSVICLILNGYPKYFSGNCEGLILSAPQGNGGFGYDPIFAPKGYQNSFGELDISVKNEISHRAKAMTQFIDFINSMPL